jgi:hypothetical protein
MENGVRIGSDLEGTFPGVLNLIHEPISAAFAHDQGDLFVDVFLQLLGVQLSDLLKQAFQLLVNSFRRF